MESRKKTQPQHPAKDLQDAQKESEGNLRERSPTAEITSDSESSSDKEKSVEFKGILLKLDEEEDDLVLISSLPESDLSKQTPHYLGNQYKSRLAEAEQILESLGVTTTTDPIAAGPAVDGENFILVQAPTENSILSLEQPPVETKGSISLAESSTTISAPIPKPSATEKSIILSSVIELPPAETKESISLAELSIAVSASSAQEPSSEVKESSVSVLSVIELPPVETKESISLAGPPTAASASSAHESEAKESSVSVLSAMTTPSVEIKGLIHEVKPPEAANDSIPVLSPTEIENSILIAPPLTELQIESSASFSSSSSPQAVTPVAVTESPIAKPPVSVASPDLEQVPEESKITDLKNIPEEKDCTKKTFGTSSQSKISFLFNRNRNRASSPDSASSRSPAPPITLSSSAPATKPSPPSPEPRRELVYEEDTRKKSWWEIWNCCTNPRKMRIEEDENSAKIGQNLPLKL